MNKVIKRPAYEETLHLKHHKAISKKRRAKLEDFTQLQDFLQSYSNHVSVALA